MSKFLVLYKAGAPGNEPTGEPTPEQQQAMMQAWFDWKDAAGDAIVDFGAPTTAVSGGGADVGGYSIVQADSVDALATIFQTNPHRQQGGNLEFHQILEIPGA
ncbi:MAG: hypothetical protein KDB71_06390 [Mycobacterium sp.]|nr:hypothetical protein [Mycobacterium sp.]